MDRERRNAGVPLDLKWLMNSAETVTPRPGTPRLREAISLLDLTSLSGDDTSEKISRVCADAKRAGVAAVCVYHAFVAQAAEELKGTGIAVAAVSAGFPHGLSALNARLLEVEESVLEGATEIDVPIPRYLALTGNWQQLYDEISALREACGCAHLKTILSVSELGSDETIRRASLVAMMAGSDYIKTSTGKEASPASVEQGRVMAQTIREYKERMGFVVGFKAAGGIRTADEALNWMTMVGTELGSEWIHPSLFRIGASSLLDELENRLGIEENA